MITSKSEMLGQLANPPSPRRVAASTYVCLMTDVTWRQEGRKKGGEAPFVTVNSSNELN